MNKLHLCGRLGADPEEKHTTTGQKLWELRVATRSYSGGQEDTIWWRVTAWGDQFDNLLRHFKKGKLIYLICDMKKLRVYNDKNGQPQVSYEATALSIDFVPVSERQEGGEGSYGGGSNGPQQPSYNSSPSYGGGSQRETAPPPYQQGSSYSAPSSPPPSNNSYGGGSSYGTGSYGGGYGSQPQAAPSMHGGLQESSFPAEEDQVPF